jgi:hypothetical protein
MVECHAEAFRRQRDPWTGEKTAANGIGLPDGPTRRGFGSGCSIGFIDVSFSAV